MYIYIYIYRVTPCAKISLAWPSCLSFWFLICLLLLRIAMLRSLLQRFAFKLDSATPHGDGEVPSDQRGTLQQNKYFRFFFFCRFSWSRNLRIYKVSSFEDIKFIVFIRKNVIFHTFQRKNMFLEAAVAPHRDSEDPSGQRGALQQNKYFRLFRFFEF